MNILYIVPYPPARTRGRTLHILNWLASRHKVQLLFDQAQGATELCEIPKSVYGHAQARPAVLWRLVHLTLHPTLIAKYPLRVLFMRNPRMVASLNYLLQSKTFDVVVVESMRAGQYVDIVRRHYGGVIVYDATDSFSLYMSRLLGQRPVGKLAHNVVQHLGLLNRWDERMSRHAERALTTMVDRVLFATSEDLKYSAELCGDSTKMTVVPNGIDLQYYFPRADVTKRTGRIVFHGRMSYQPNVLAALTLIRLLGQLPQSFSLALVGENPDPALFEARDRTSYGARVEIIGQTPDIRDYIRSAEVEIVPIALRVGMQNKVLEALACGTPVITTPIVAQAFGDRIEGVSTFGGESELISMLCRGSWDPVTTETSKQLEERFSWGTILKDEILRRSD